MFLNFPLHQPNRSQDAREVAEGGRDDVPVDVLRYLRGGYVAVEDAGDFIPHHGEEVGIICQPAADDYTLR